MTLLVHPVFWLVKAQHLTPSSYSECGEISKLKQQRPCLGLKTDFSLLVEAELAIG